MLAARMGQFATVSASNKYRDREETALLYFKLSGHVPFQICRPRQHNKRTAADIICSSS